MTTVCLLGWFQLVANITLLQGRVFWILFFLIQAKLSVDAPSLTQLSWHSWGCQNKPQVLVRCWGVLTKRTSPWSVMSWTMLTQQKYTLVPLQLFYSLGSWKIPLLCRHFQLLLVWVLLTLTLFQLHLIANFQSLVPGKDRGNEMKMLSVTSLVVLPRK